jgi:hypothetical protein
MVEDIFLVSLLYGFCLFTVAVSTNINLFAQIYLLPPYIIIPNTIASFIGIPFSVLLLFKMFKSRDLVKREGES